MSQPADDMKRFLDVYSNVFAPKSVQLEPVEFEDPQQQTVQIDLEDIQDLMFKLRNYRETSLRKDYALGVEQGLNLAADMLERLIEKSREQV